MKVPAEEAIASIQNLILSGYKLKEDVEAEYAELRTNQAEVMKAAEGWKVTYAKWVRESMEALDKIYESPVYMYNFRDASPTSGMAMVGNVVRSNIVLNTQSRIEKLNEYEQFIRTRVPITVVINGDQYSINGDNNRVKSKR